LKYEKIPDKDTMKNSNKLGTHTNGKLACSNVAIVGIDGPISELTGVNPFYDCDEMMRVRTLLSSWMDMVMHPSFIGYDIALIGIPPGEKEMDDSTRVAYLKEFWEEDNYIRLGKPDRNKENMVCGMSVYSVDVSKTDCINFDKKFRSLVDGYGFTDATILMGNICYKEPRAYSSAILQVIVDKFIKIAKSGLMVAMEFPGRFTFAFTVSEQLASLWVWDRKGDRCLRFKLHTLRGVLLRCKSVTTELHTYDGQNILVVHCVYDEELERKTIKDVYYKLLRGTLFGIFQFEDRVPAGWRFLADKSKIGFCFRLQRGKFKEPEFKMNLIAADTVTTIFAEGILIWLASIDPGNLADPTETVWGDAETYASKLGSYLCDKNIWVIFPMKGVTTMLAKAFISEIEKYKRKGTVKVSSHHLLMEEVVYVIVEDSMDLMNNLLTKMIVSIPPDLSPYLEGDGYMLPFPMNINNQKKDKQFFKDFDRSRFYVLTGWTTPHYRAFIPDEKIVVNDMIAEVVDFAKTVDESKLKNAPSFQKLTKRLMLKLDDNNKDNTGSKDEILDASENEL
jgi:hypothetical protein